MSDLNRREFLMAAAGAATAGRATGAATRPPNIVMILCDDLGYGDVGSYGSAIRTPNLDRMAADGIRFTNFLTANPVCSPSRAALLTGRYPTRVGVPRVLFPKDSEGLPDTEVTLAQALKARGYKSMCVGKWHLGHLPQFLPTNRGFDAYFGIPYSNDMEPPVLLRNTETFEERADMNRITGQYTEEAVKFIERSKDSPFFLYLAHTMPHIPLGAGKRFRGRSPQGLYGDVVEEIDWSVGEVLSTLRKLGLENNTLVMFASDNGPWHQGSPGRLRGRKGMTWEGGVRTPFIARFPGRIPAGKVCHGVGSLMDVFPTVIKLAGAPAPKNPLDGIDIWPMLTGQKPEIEREALLYFDGWHIQCARRGRWKLHLSRYNSVTYSPAPAGGRLNIPLPAPELYDLSRDVDESYDVAPEHPEIVKDLTARVNRLLAGFPEPVQKAWRETQARKPRKTAVGAVTAEDKPAEPKKK